MGTRPATIYRFASDGAANLTPLGTGLRNVGYPNGGPLPAGEFNQMHREIGDFITFAGDVLSGDWILSTNTLVVGGGGTGLGIQAGTLFSALADSALLELDSGGLASSEGFVATRNTATGLHYKYDAPRTVTRDVTFGGWLGHSNNTRPVADPGNQRVEPFCTTATGRMSLGIDDVLPAGDAEHTAPPAALKSLSCVLSPTGDADAILRLIAQDRATGVDSVVMTLPPSGTAAAAGAGDTPTSDTFATALPLDTSANRYRLEFLTTGVVPGGAGINGGGVGQVEITLEERSP